MFMTELLPQAFFTLEEFAHATIFDGCTYVWEVIPRISTYLQNYPLGKIESEIPSGAFLSDPQLISIKKNVVIEPGAYIQGPCILEEDCIVRQGAYIRGNVITGKGAVIGHTSEIKNSILLNRAHAAHFAYVGDSILGNDVNLGAGSICANLRLDRMEVIIHFANQRIRTHLKKFGAILGDRTQLGCNTVTNPGTLTQKDVICYPCVNFGGFIPENSIIKTNSALVITKN